VKIHNTTIEVVRGSVLDQNVDAIVNAANTGMRGGGGVDGAIHRAAGPGLLQELKQVAPSGAATGTAVLTRGHNLQQPYIIHTPGPVWSTQNAAECEKLLRSCYRLCLETAEEKQLQSLAFCSISTGVYGYPIEQAAPAAVETVTEYLKSQPQTSLRAIIFAMFGEQEYQTFQAALEELRTKN
jgi:O-acetyl-ADP-ribose deacetylase (regulator of RNase III)